MPYKKMSTQIKRNIDNPNSFVTSIAQRHNTCIKQKSNKSLEAKLLFQSILLQKTRREISSYCRKRSRQNAVLYDIHYFAEHPQRPCNKCMSLTNWICVKHTSEKLKLDREIVSNNGSFVSLLTFAKHKQIVLSQDLY